MQVPNKPKKWVLGEENSYGKPRLAVLAIPGPPWIVGLITILGLIACYAIKVSPHRMDAKSRRCSLWRGRTPPGCAGKCSCFLHYDVYGGAGYAPCNLRKRNWRDILALCFLPLIAFVIASDYLYEKGNAFLAPNATIYGPIAGILLIDYIFLRREKVNMSQIFVVLCTCPPFYSPV
jgi:hypothetical protein